MPLIALRNVTLSFGLAPLLDKVNFSLDRRERVCLVGRNGSGKSTLLKLISGAIQPDSGEIAIERSVTITQLAQEVPQDISGKVTDLLSKELPKIEPWEVKQRVEELLSLLALDGDSEFSTLSGGMKRRVLLAKALITKPDLLLLDEPTNHLDIENIEWLEQFLKKYNGTILFVTHDRFFLQKIATRIIELDRGNLASFECDYNNYLKRKQAFLEAQATENDLFDKKLAAEEVWIRQGIKARRTRNEGRVADLKKLRQQRSERRDVIGKVKIEIQQTKESGKAVIEAENISYAFDELIIKNFSATIARSDKIGIIGPNGCGKTTLLRLLLGELKPQSGKIKTGSKLQVAYFDQLRNQFDEDKSLRENIGEGSDFITINGKERHIISYLRDFLFPPERALSKVKQLSGGERNRLLLAKLFTKPSNVLVLDEPTNDLDIETLELLEALLVDYPGTVLLVSHDRVFLNNVVTSTFVFEGNGKIEEYLGGYDDWLRQRKAPLLPAKATTKTVTNNSTEKKAPTYKERKEVAKLLRKIEQLEKKKNDLHQKMAAPDFYKTDQNEIDKINSELRTIEEELKITYEHWEELES